MVLAVICFVKSLCITTAINPGGIIKGGELISHFGFYVVVGQGFVIVQGTGLCTSTA